MVQCRGACGDARFPPSPVCPRCLGAEQTWKEASGRATLQSWAEFHRAWWDGFKPDLPYKVCLVQREEGLLLVGNLVGSGNKAKLGAPVRVVFEPVTDEVTLSKFTLV